MKLWYFFYFYELKNRQKINLSKVDPSKNYLKNKNKNEHYLNVHFNNQGSDSEPKNRWSDCYCYD